MANPKYINDQPIHFGGNPTTCCDCQCDCDWLPGNCPSTLTFTLSGFPAAYGVNGDYDLEWEGSFTVCDSSTTTWYDSWGFSQCLDDTNNDFIDLNLTCALDTNGDPIWSLWVHVVKFGQDEISEYYYADRIGCCPSGTFTYDHGSNTHVSGSVSL